MKSFKKILAGILALLTLIPLAACSADSGTSTGEETTAAAETTAAEVENAEKAYNISDYVEKRDLNGLEYKVLAFGDLQIGSIYVEEETGSLIDDAVYKKVMAVEEYLNCDIQASGLCMYGDLNEAGKNVIQNSVMSGEHEFDLVQTHDITIADFSLEHYFVNLHELDSFNFDADWYSENTIDSLTIGDTMYLLSCDASYYGTADMRAMFFNKNLANDYGLDNLYKTVDDGDWTFDYMNGVVKQVYSDVNGNNERDNGDVYGFVNHKSYYGWLEAMDIEHFVEDSDGSVIYEFDIDKNLRIVEAVYDLMFTSGGSYFAVDDTERGDMFCSEQALFTYDKMTGAVKKYSFSDVSYGVLPMPKLSDDVDEYFGGRTDRPMGIPMTVPVDIIEDVALITEAMTVEGYYNVFPVYYETALKTRYSDTDDDARMIDIVHDNVVLSFSYIYGQYTSTYMKLLASHVNPDTPSKDVASFAASLETTMIERAAKINEAFNAK